VPWQRREAEVTPQNMDGLVYPTWAGFCCLHIDVVLTA
jgi:hypothetical protein